MNQKTAVYNAITDVLARAGIDFTDGMNIKDLMTKERRAIVNAVLIEGFTDGTIELDREYSDSELKTYVSGLQSNWIKKDKRFNGGVKHVAANPGSRAGASDQSLVNAKRLLAELQNDPKSSADDVSMVEEFIAERTAAIAAEKAKTVSVDFSKLPEALRKFAKA